MKILVATGIYPPDIGGPATYSKLLYDEMPKRGVSVNILSFGEVKNLPKIIRHIFFIYKLLIRAFSADIIFAQDTVSVGFPSLIVSKLLGKKFMVRVPGDYAWEQSVQRYGVKETIDDFQAKKYGKDVELLRNIQKMTVNGADTVITPSQYFKTLVSKWVKNPQKVICIYNGIDLSEIPKADGKYDSKTIVSAGRLVSWKGFTALITSLKSLPMWKLYIAGDGPIKNELIDHAKSEGVSDRVNFLGQIPRKDLIDRIQRSDVFVLNTHFESFSFQVVEAMATGTPVVTTNVGNLAEIVDHNINGILVTPDDIEAIVSSCERLSTDNPFRESIITSAYKKAGSFSIERTLDSLQNIL